mmetsp:Transcript_27066/g.40073  ORF Transcript_27066/g.40073 Transcript_27066/m.40073 type:complete len:877 (-) Transcript_27066:218-2848(-)
MALSPSWASTPPERLFLLILISLSLLFNFALAGEYGGGGDNGGGGNYRNSSSEHGGGVAPEEAHPRPYTAVLFPWFVQLLGVVVFYIITRVISAIPYTAIMFLLGAAMGAGSVLHGADSEINATILQWTDINAEVLLLVFLPGLLFRDALHVNWHLFCMSVSQIMIMAFPMVLAGTTLTALVAFYVFPFGWSLNLCMAFGSIMAATDPVAVSALLNEVGAPPRLKIHISGESMFNDGSAIVFYTIFSSMYLYELGIEGLGQQYGVGEGFSKFFLMALGGAAWGVLMGLGLSLVLFLLNRRFDHEENVVQVAATISIAYITFYTAEITLKMSGVIAVVVCGIATQGIGYNSINDQPMMESFWTLVEHLLNTVIFALGGLVWGEVIVLESIHLGRNFYGYLVLFYILVVAIRYFLVFAFYPILSRLGIKTNWREAVFMSYGGLRGAVGIALALALQNEVYSADLEGEAQAIHQTDVSQVFAMVGGIALLTLVINGSTSGPLLRKLGLVDSTKIRSEIVAHFQEDTKRRVHDAFVHLLSHPNYYHVDFALVKYHVKMLSYLTLEEFKTAIFRNKKMVPSAIYKKPNINNILPYLLRTGDGKQVHASAISGLEEFTSLFNVDTDNGDVEQCVNTETIALSGDEKERAMELRKIFIELLRHLYHIQLEKGELSGRSTVEYIIFNGLEYTSDHVSRGGALNDWDAQKHVRRHTKWFDPCRTEKRAGLRIEVQLAISFIEAHKAAQAQFLECDTFTDAQAQVIEESKVQVRMAEDVLKFNDKDLVQRHVSLLFCKILLNKQARFLQNLAEKGQLSSREVHHPLAEVEKAIRELTRSPVDGYPDQMDTTSKKHSVYEVINPGHQEVTDSDPSNEEEVNLNTPLL